MFADHLLCYRVVPRLFLFQLQIKRQGSFSYPRCSGSPWLFLINISIASTLLQFIPISFYYSLPSLCALFSGRPFKCASRRGNPTRISTGMLLSSSDSVNGRVALMDINMFVRRMTFLFKQAPPRCSRKIKRPQQFAHFNLIALCSISILLYASHWPPVLLTLPFAQSLKIPRHPAPL
jgi:hypothetical protein